MITVDHCSWDQPGTAPFRGDVPAAVAHYSEIPAPIRAELRARMERRQFDDVAEIRRDSVVGRRTYSDLRSMHFANTFCRNVSRAKWTDSFVERGLVYCVEEHCVIVPTVCNNVSRITRMPERAAPMASSEPPADLAFEAPGAIAGDPSAQAGMPPAQEAPPLAGTPLAGLAPGPADTFAGGSTLPIGWPAGIGLLPASNVTATPVAEIPEPGTWLLMLAGIAGLASLRPGRRGP